jgi:hypothetical protein
MDGRYGRAIDAALRPVLRCLPTVSFNPVASSRKRMSCRIHKPRCNSTLFCLFGGHRESGAGAEGCLGVGGLDLFQSSLPLDDVCTARTGMGLMLGVYGTLGIFWLLAARDPSANRKRIASRHGQVLSTPRLPQCSMPQSDGTPRVSGRGCARYDRCSPDGAGSKKAVGRGEIRSCCLDSSS